MTKAHCDICMGSFGVEIPKHAMDKAKFLTCSSGTDIPHHCQQHQRQVSLLQSVEARLHDWTAKGSPMAWQIGLGCNQTDLAWVGCGLVPKTGAAKRHHHRFLAQGQMSCNLKMQSVKWKPVSRQNLCTLVITKVSCWAGQTLNNENQDSFQKWAPANVAGRLCALRSWPDALSPNLEYGGHHTPEPMRWMMTTDAFARWHGWSEGC